MTIHVLPIIDFILVTFCYIFFDGVLAMIILWPVNDQKTSLSRKVVFGVLTTIMGIFWYGWVYGFIHFVR